MKKFLLAAALIGSAMMANAEETFAPSAGTCSTEIQFAPFSSQIFSTGGALSSRYFLTSKDALVVEFGLSGTNNKDVDDTANPDAFTKDYKGRFVINLGYQRHYYNYKRIDLYCGGKLGYIHDFAGNKDQLNENNWTWNNSGTGNGFNLYLTNGIDFYVYKGLYLGAEINIGFTDVVNTKYTTKTCVNGQTSTLKTTNGGHKFSGGFDVNPKFRLGWNF